MFDTLIVQPVFNLLTFIYAVMPGHDLGIAIIIFTVIIRLMLWPLVHKQLHHAKLMRKLQPELKKLKKAAKGDRQKEARLQMELYKERGIKPFASIGTLIIQIPVFIGLYQAVLKITNNPNSLLDFSYPVIRDLSWIQHVGQNISQFDETFLGLVDLTRSGFEGGLYLPAIVLAVFSTVMQYFQMKLTISNNQDARKLSEILKEAAAGKETDQTEVTAAVSKLMLIFLPVFTFVFALIVPSALALYLFTSSAMGYLQQRRVLREDSEEMHEIAEEKTPAEKEIELLAAAKKTKTPARQKKKTPAKNKKTSGAKKKGKK